MTSYTGYISDMTAAQQSGGKGAELWMIDATGQLWTDYQTAAGGSWSGWSAPRFQDQPVPALRVTAADQNTGCLILFILDLEGGVWSIKQLSPGGAWGEWEGPWIAGQPVPFVEIAAAAQSGNRGVSLKAIDLDGQIWVLYQTTPGGAWSSWEGPGFKNQPKPMTLLTQAGQNNGCLVLFTTDSDGAVWAIKQQSPGGDYGAWTGPWLANQPKPFYRMSAAQQSGNRGVSLKTIDQSGNIWVLYQTTPGGAWSSWEGPGFKNQPKPMRLVTQAGQGNGCLELFSIANDGYLWTVKQQSAGGDYGAWSTMPMPSGNDTSGWTEAGSGYTSIVGAGGGLYAVDAGNVPWLFSGTPGVWTKVGEAGYQFVGTSDAFYAITADKSAVTSYDSVSNTWTTIGGAMAELIPAWTALHGVDADGYAWMYSGQPNQWHKVGGPFHDVSANDSYCFAIAADRKSVLMTPTGSGVWQTIGGAMESLVASGDNIYGLDANGALYLYSGTPMQWTRIGAGFAQVITWGVNLYGLAADRSAVLAYDADLDLWVAVAGPTSAIASGSEWIAGLQSGTVSVCCFGDETWPGETSEVPEDTAVTETVVTETTVTETAAADTGSTAPIDSVYKWMIRLRISLPNEDDHTCYLGKIRLSINADNHYRTHPAQAFEPGSDYTFSADFADDAISTLKIWVSDHYLANKLTVNTIVAWNTKNGNFYHFDVNQSIPGQYNKLILQPSSSVGTPVHTGPSVVYIWQAKNYFTKQVGHASMQLSDGTYISWWPVTGADPQYSVLPETFKSTHIENRTYQDDKTGEGNQPPDIVVHLWDLDESAIKKWWTSYDADPNNLYVLLSNNCSTIVFRALQIGGALSVLTPEDQQHWSANAVWTPMVIENLMIELQETTFTT